MGIFETSTRFVQAGAEHEHADERPVFAPGSVRMFTYGDEPEVIAQIPLKGGGTVEVHGYASHYTREWVQIVWTDEALSHMVCWVPAADVRRPAEGEWQGLYVAR